MKQNSYTYIISIPILYQKIPSDCNVSIRVQWVISICISTYAFVLNFFYSLTIHRQNRTQIWPYKIRERNILTGRWEGASEREEDQSKDYKPLIQTWVSLENGKKLALHAQNKILKTPKMGNRRILNKICDGIISAMEAIGDFGVNQESEKGK